MRVAGGPPFRKGEDINAPTALTAVRIIRDGEDTPVGMDGRGWREEEDAEDADAAVLLRLGAACAAPIGGSSGGGGGMFDMMCVQCYVLIAAAVFDD